MYILLHVRVVFVVVGEFVGGVGLGGRTRGRAPGAPWLRFGFGTIRMKFIISPHKRLPRYRCDDGCKQWSVAPLRWWGDGQGVRGRGWRRATGFGRSRGDRHGARLEGRREIVGDVLVSVVWGARG